jgi:hypothetical protein
MRITLFILSGLIYISFCHGQTFEQSVSGFYFNPDFPGRNILLTGDGDYVLAGKSLSINGLSSITLSMFHQDGTRLWTNNYETGEYGNFHLSLESATANEYFLIASGPYMTRIIRTDQDGRRLWTTSINYEKYDDRSPMLLTTDSAVFLLCGTRELGPGENHQRVITLTSVDTSGNISGERIIRSYRHLTLHSVARTADKGWFITGHTGFTYPEGSNLYLARTNQAGDTLWTCEYKEIMNCENSAACQLKNKQFVVTGTFRSESNFQDRIFLLWVDKDGNKILYKTFPGEMYRAYSVIQTYDNGYAITGSTESLGNGQKELFILKTDILGQTQWLVTYGGAYDDCGYEIRHTSDSGYIITGSTESYGKDYSYLIRTDALGKVDCRLDHSKFFSPLIHSVSTDNQSGTVMINYEPVSGDAEILLYKESALPGSFLLINKKGINEAGAIYDSTALPGLRSYKYLIRIINECNDTSLSSTLHGTVFLEAFTGGNDSRNLIWNHYTGAEIETYVILRGTSVNDMSELDFVPGMVNTYSDLNPPAGTVHYQIKALLLHEVSDKLYYPYISYSNIASLSALSEHLVQPSPLIRVYPNPANAILTIDFPNPGNEAFTFSLYDLSGRLIRSFRYITGDSFVFQRYELPPGLYIVELTGPASKYRALVIFE